MNKFIKKIDNLYHSKGATEEQIITVEKELGLIFPNSYREYLKEYGAISFFGTELTGLNVDDYIDVLKVTEREKMLDNKFPKGYFVLENIGIDGILILMNENGEVFSYKNNDIEKYCDSFKEYIKICIDRKNK